MPRPGAQDDPPSSAFTGQLISPRFQGSLAGAGWKKDPASSFYYSQRATSAGSAYGAYNLAQCYCDGAGTPKDYALAAVYFQKSRLGAVMCYIDTRRLVDRCLAFVPD